MEISSIKRGYVDPDTDDLKTFKQSDGVHVPVAGIRDVDTQTVTIAAGAALSSAIDMRRFSGGFIMVSVWGGSAAIAFKKSTSEDGTYGIVRDTDGATLLEIGTVTAGEWIALPSVLFPSHFLKVWSETGESDVTQANEVTITVALKA